VTTLSSRTLKELPKSKRLSIKLKLELFRRLKIEFEGQGKREDRTMRSKTRKAKKTLKETKRELVQKDRHAQKQLRTRPKVLRMRSRGSPHKQKKL